MAEDQRATTRRTLLRQMIAAAAVIPAMAKAEAQTLDDPFHQAARAGDAAATAKLIAAGTPLDIRDRRGRTPLLVATALDHVSVARLLIEAGADVNAQDEQRDSCFLLAGAEGRLEILQLAIAHGADVRSTNRYGGTALIPACERAHLEVVQVLLATPIDVNHVNRLGWTALMEAVVLGDGGPRHVEVVRLLVESGRLDPDIPDKDGVTAIRHARLRGYARIVALLEGAGAR